MARGRKKRDKKWMWIVKPGDRIFVSRTAVILSKQLSRREFRALEEILSIYTKMLGDVLSYASKNIIENHHILRNDKYQEKEYVSQHPIPLHTWLMPGCS
jgi:predicted metallo-beta-lactamase superfamily hydrolase